MSLSDISRITLRRQKKKSWRFIDCYKKGRLDQEFAPDGYNIGVNVGLYGGQTVMHLHVHLIPRYKGDVADPRGGIRKAIPNLVPYPPEEKETNHADL